MHDLKYALRQLAKAPVFTVVALLSLAIGCGANTAIFSIVNALALRRLPVRAPEELRLVNWAGREPQFKSYSASGGGMEHGRDGEMIAGFFPYPTYVELTKRSSEFGTIFAFAPTREITVRAGRQTISGEALLVSGNFFSGYGATPMLGRTLAPSDDRPDAAPVAVISHRYWSAYHGKDPAVIGQTLALNGTLFEIAGVLRSSFSSPLIGDPADVYVTLSHQPQLLPGEPLESSQHWWVYVMARLSAGSSASRTEAMLTASFKQSVQSEKAQLSSPRIVLRDGSQGLSSSGRESTKASMAIFAVVGLVLLVACVNLAGMLLARGAARQHECAIRAAMGASGWRLVRPTLVESFVLSLAGAGLGLLVAEGIGALLLHSIQVVQPHLHIDIVVDWRVVLFTFGLAMLATIASGTLPALSAARVNLLAGLKSKTAAGVPRLRFGKALVALQVAISIFLATGAGLIVRSFVNVQRVEKGFDPKNVMLFGVNAAHAGYKSRQLANVYEDLQRSIGALPGVRAAAFSNVSLTGNRVHMESLRIPGSPTPEGKPPQATQLTLSEGFFSTMGIPLLLGRDFSANDAESGPPVAVVNETFARSFFSGRHPVGQTVIVGKRTYTVIGVCKDFILKGRRQPVSPLMCFSYRQRSVSGIVFHVKTAQEPFSAVPAIRSVMATVNSTIAPIDVTTVEAQIARSLAIERVLAALGTALAITSVLLACLGLYGLMSYNVARRAAEMGLRLALGATPGTIRLAMLREALLVTGTGVAIGAPIAIGAAAVARSLLFGLKPYDPPTTCGCVLAIFAAAAIAAWIPALRASRVDPMVALRAE